MRVVIGLVIFGSLAFGQVCAPRRILPDGGITGTLDDSSCQLTDATAYAAYRLDLPARGTIDIALTTTQDFVLALRDSTGALVASGTPIHRPVEAGSYTLLVNARVPGQVGDYSVKTAFAVEPGTICAAFPSLGENQTTAGKLGASGCALPDGTPYEAYWLTTFGAGALTVTVTSTDFTPAIFVRTPDGALAASGGGTVTLTADGDTRYQVVVATSDTAGAYQIATSFQPDASTTCRPVKTLAASAADAGAITGDSCAATIPGSGDLQYYNYYSIQLDAAGLADFAVASADFLPTLYLADAGGNTLALDAGGAAGGSEIRMQLRPGAYTLVIQSSVPSGGSYNLKYQFTPGAPRPCSPAALPAAGGGQSGSLSAVSCRTDLGAADLYTLTLPSSGTLDLAMSTDPALTGAIAIRDAKDNLILTTSDVQGLGMIHLAADLPAGAYTVVAASAGGSGAYQLTNKLTAHDLAPCGYVQPLDANGGYVKRLSSFSCRGANGAPVDWFEFTMPADGTAVMVLTTSEMDGYLTLTDTQGNVLRSDDNSYGYADPMIVQYLPAGTYRLAARSASGDDGGLYEVDVRSILGPRPGFCAPRSSLAPGGSVSGNIGFTGCPYDGAFADLYRLDVANGATVDIRLNSTDFDAYLVLLDAKGNVVEQDDDSGGDTDARINTALPAGTYYIVAKPSTDFTAAGAYKLTVQ